MTLDTKHLRALRAAATQGEWVNLGTNLGLPMAETPDHRLIVAAVNALEALCDAAEERDRLEEQLEGVVGDTAEAARGIREALGRLDPMTDRYGKSLADAVRAVVAERDTAVEMVRRLRLLCREAAFRLNGDPAGADDPLMFALGAAGRESTCPECGNDTGGHELDCDTLKGGG